MGVLGVFWQILLRVLLGVVRKFFKNLYKGYMRCASMIHPCKMMSETDQEPEVAEEDGGEDQGRTTAVLVSDCPPEHGRDEHA